MLAHFPLKPSYYRLMSNINKPGALWGLACVVPKNIDLILVLAVLVLKLIEFLLIIQCHF